MKQVWIIVCSVGTVCVLAIVLLWTVSDSSTTLQLHMLDVGQGDALLLETPSGYQALIDGGTTDGIVVRELESVMDVFDRTIDMVMLTHPDADHVGGLAEVLHRYNVDTIIDNGIEKETDAANAFRIASQRESGVLVRQVTAGDIIQLPDNVHITILHPFSGYSSDEINNYSIVARIDYGNTSVLVTGDIDSSVEMSLLDRVSTDSLDIDVLKIAHHGSRHSSALSFLQVAVPDVALASYDCDNSYGHPHDATVRRYQYIGVPVYDTCHSGRVTVDMDGTRFWVSTEQ